MEVIKGKIVSTGESKFPEKEIEYFTDPVPVRKYKLPFMAVVVVQLFLAALSGVLLIWAVSSDSDTSVVIENVIRRLLNG